MSTAVNKCLFWPSTLHQKWEKTTPNNTTSSDLWLSFTYFHLYLEIFGHAGKLYKNIKIKQLEAIGEGGPPWATWSSATSPIHGKWPRNTLPSFLHRWFQVGAWSRVEKRHHMDCWLTILYVGCSNGQMVFIPTLYYIPRGPHRRSTTRFRPYCHLTPFASPQIVL